jgi:riboflavin synthase
MFTGIIEASGKVIGIEKEGSNLHLTISSPLSGELKIDQSLSHNGVCLTVVASAENWHRVTAVAETLQRSNIGDLTIDDQVNLERAMSAAMRMDGHIVQGHVDATGICESVETQGGSWLFTFSFDPKNAYLIVDKGSVSVNGVSLTVVNPTQDRFSVAIIPYTFDHTNFNLLKKGDRVNLEFDIIGKYVARYMERVMSYKL